MGRADEGVAEEGFCGYGAGGGARGFVRIMGFESSSKQSQKRAMGSTRLIRSPWSNRTAGCGRCGLTGWQDGIGYGG